MWGRRGGRKRGRGARGPKGPYFGQTMPLYHRGNLIPLIMLAPGQSGEVVDIDAGIGLWERLMGMGIRPGVRIQVLANDYRGVIVAVNNTRYALGRGMAEGILVKPISY